MHPVRTDTGISMPVPVCVPESVLESGTGTGTHTGTGTRLRMRPGLLKSCLQYLVKEKYIH